MNPKEYYQKKTQGFLNYWVKKRKNRLKYAVFESLYFSIPFSLFLSILNDGFSEIVSLHFVFKLSSIFLIYFLYSYGLVFKLHEKRYQKLKKEQQNFDQG